MLIKRCQNALHLLLKLSMTVNRQILSKNHFYSAKLFNFQAKLINDKENEAVQVKVSERFCHHCKCVLYYNAVCYRFF